MLYNSHNMVNISWTLILRKTNFSIYSIFALKLLFFLVFYFYTYYLALYGIIWYYHVPCYFKYLLTEFSNDKHVSIISYGFQCCCVLTFFITLPI